MLWLVRDGVGLTDSRNLKTTQASSTVTKAVMMTMIHSTSVLKSWMASFTGPAAGCRPMPQGVGAPTERASPHDAARGAAACAEAADDGERNEEAGQCEPRCLSEQSPDHTSLPIPVRAGDMRRPIACPPGRRTARAPCRQGRNGRGRTISPGIAPHK